TDATFPDNYRRAILKRRSSGDIPPRSQVEAIENDTVKERLIALLDKCPNEDKVKEDTPMEKLVEWDQLIAELILLWKERERPGGKEVRYRRHRAAGTVQARRSALLGVSQDAALRDEARYYERELRQDVQPHRDLLASARGPLRLTNSPPCVTEGGVACLS